MAQNASWLTQSLLGAFLLTPTWLAIGFFERSFHVKPEIFLIWYLLGISAASVIYGRSDESGPLLPPVAVMCGIVLIGITFGGWGNVLIFFYSVGGG